MNDDAENVLAFQGVPIPGRKEREGVGTDGSISNLRHRQNVSIPW